MAAAGTASSYPVLARSGEAPAWWRDAGAGHEGRELEGAGRLRALAFPDTLAALGCATELQRGQPRAGNSRLRVGIDAGEEDRIDPPPAVAGRLCDRAEPGQVLVSQAAHSLAEARGEHRFREVGALALDGLRSPVHTWELLWGQPEPRTRIRLCGGLELAIDGRDLAALLPAGQAGALLCYLLANRERAHDREALVALLWPEHPPKEPLAALRPLLSRLRRAISPAVIEGRGRIRVEFPEPIWVDIEEAARALESARRTARSEAWEIARDHAGTALELLRPRFLPAEDAEWVDVRRRELEELELEALEWVARSGLKLGEPELGGAERASRDLMAQAPYRETGYRFLMEALARSGNVAEALRVLRSASACCCATSSGPRPAAELQALHQRLLTGDGFPRARRARSPAAETRCRACCRRASGPSS